MNKVSRSIFLKTMFTGALALQLPFVFSCNNQGVNDFELTIDDNLYQVNTTDLKLVLDVLLPTTEEGPGALDLKADIYFMWITADSRVDNNRRVTLLSSISKINDYAIRELKKPLQKLSKIELQDFIKIVSITHWGEKALSLTLTVCFEAMFANPVYGSNPDYIGWKWLNYQGGIPQPNKENKYPEILSIAL